MPDFEQVDNHMIDKLDLSTIYHLSWGYYIHEFLSHGNQIRGTTVSRHGRGTMILKVFIFFAEQISDFLTRYILIDLDKS